MPCRTTATPSSCRPATRTRSACTARSYDGAGNPIPDALIEIWQADAEGQVPQVEGSLRRDGWTFTGFGRAAVDDNGHYSFTTLAPGRHPMRGRRHSSPSPCSPAGCSTVSSPASTCPTTRPRSAPTPCSPRCPRNGGRRWSPWRTTHGFRFDLRLQGEGETVFLQFPDA